MKQLYPLLLLIFALSCGQEEVGDIPEGHTKVYFSSSNEDKATLNGGLIIYLQNLAEPHIRGAKFMQNETDTALTGVLLRNGPYTFTSVGYGLISSGDSIAISGQNYYCGHAPNPIMLDGGVVTINLTLGNQSSYPFCSHPFFARPEFVNTGASPTTLKLVNKVWYCTSGSPTTPVSGSCSGAGSPGTAGSLKIHMLSLKPIGPANDPFSVLQMNKAAHTPCQAVSLGAATIGFPFLVPVGNGPASPYALSVEVFSDGGCSTLIKEYNYPHGISNPGGGPGGKMALSYPSGGNYIEMYLQE